LPICAQPAVGVKKQGIASKKLKPVLAPIGCSRPPVLSYKMSTWSKSALKSSSSVIVSDKSFPALGGGAATGPPSKKPVLSFAQKVKETVEAEAAAAEAKRKADAERAAAKALETTRYHVPVVSHFYKSYDEKDEEYAREDGSPDEMDYEASVEYAEHLEYNRKQRTYITDYSKDLSSEEEHDNTYDDRAI